MEVRGMDWQKQTEEMFKNWASAQMNMLDAFSESVASFGKSPGEKLWDQIISTGEEMIKNALSGQAEWMNIWIENYQAIEGLPDQAAESSEQYQEMNSRWLETQKRLWTAWFDLVKKVDVSSFSDAWRGYPGDPFKVWQETSKMVMNSQMEWLRSWSAQFDKGKKD
jgi:hypothetical protein